MHKVGVLGSASVGQTLARGFKGHGYDVRIGSRSPAKLSDFSSSAGIPAATFAGVGGWADLLVLSVHGRAAADVLALAGGESLAGKIVIDTTNPLGDAPPVDGVLQFFTSPNTSLMESLQTAYPSLRFVKAFSCVGNARMVNPSFERGTPTMFYCGNDAEAKRTVAEILTKFGWEPADMGTAVAARAIEPLCQLWCIPGFRENKWTHAFAVFWS